MTSQIRLLPLRLLPILLLVPFLHAAPRLVVFTPNLVPESKIDVVFEKAVIDAETIGSSGPNQFFTVVPSLPGSLRWKTANIVEFLPDKAPAMSSEYVFTMVDGKKHADGSAIPPGEFARVKSEEFRPRGWNSVGSRWSSDFSRSSASWVIYFNDEVDPAVFTPLVFFRSSEGKVVQATVQPVSYKNMNYSARNQRAWSARFRQDATPPKPNLDDLVPHAIMVTPATPLPPPPRTGGFSPKRVAQSQFHRTPDQESLLHSRT